MRYLGKCVVLGGSGFIGRALVERLKPDASNIRVLCRGSQGNSELTGVEYTYADYNDTETLRAVLRQCDTCFHLISTSVPASSNFNIIDDLDSNIRGAVNLLNICLEAGVERLIFLSSGGTVYGQGRGRPSSEDDPIIPISAYGVAKATVELYLHLYQHNFGIDFRVARLSNPYGPGQLGRSGQGVVRVFMERIAGKMPIKIIGDGLNVRDYIFIDDAVEAIWKLGIAPLADSGRRTYNIGSGVGINILQLIQYLESVMQMHAIIEYEPIRKFDVRYNVLDCSNIYKDLMFMASTDLTSGLSATWQTLQSRF